MSNDGSRVFLRSYFKAIAQGAVARVSAVRIVGSGTDLLFKLMAIWAKSSWIFKNKYRENGLVPLWKYGFEVKEHWRWESVESILLPFIQGR